MMAASEPKTSFIENVQKLFDNHTYSDLTVKCGDREWLVHEAIVCTRSEWFANNLEHGTTVSSTAYKDLKILRNEDSVALNKEHSLTNM